MPRNDWSLLAPALAVAAIAFSCREAKPPQGSAVQDFNGNITSFWLRSPESIVGTFRDTWGLPMSEQEQWDLIYGSYAVLGGLVVINQQAGVVEPNGPYVIAIDRISEWAGDRLVAMEKAKSAAGEAYMFEGFQLDPDQGLDCFAAEEGSWCPFADRLKIGDIAALNQPASSLPAPMRRRMQHNLQDISDFMLLGFENRLKGPDGTGIFQHLVDSVLAEEESGQVMDLAAEERIWKRLIYLMMMTGNFYINI